MGPHGHSRDGRSGRSIDRSGLMWLAWLLGLAAAYYVTGRIGLLLAVPPGYATAAWPPSGIALAALLVYGSRLWPGILLGSFALNVGVGLDAGAPVAASVAVATSIGLGASLQAIAGAALIRRFVSQPLELVTVRDIGRFLLLGGPIACLVNPTWSLATLATAGLLAWRDVPFTWWTWWVGDTIGVVVVTPLVLVWLSRPRAFWRRRRAAVTLPLTLLFALVVTLFLLANAAGHARRQRDFDARAAAVRTALANETGRAIEAVQGLVGLFAASQQVEADEFRTFAAATLQRDRILRALQWCPVVTWAERAAFEAGAAGLDAGVPIRQLGPDGRLVAAPSRATYVPVRYVEPRAEHAALLGFDLTSDPARRAALELAQATGRPAASAPLRLLPQAGGSRTVLVVVPVFALGSRPTRVAGRERPYGYMVGVLQLDALFAAAVAGAVASGLEVRVDDVQAASAEPPLWTSAAGSAADEPLFRAEGTVELADRRWLVRCRSLLAYETRLQPWEPWAVLAAGLLFSGLVGTLQLVGTGRAVQDEGAKAAQAAQLAAANAALQRQIAERELAEQNLRAKEAELRQSQKMEAIGRLAGGIAHDFNNLLTAIVGGSSMLVEDLPAGGVLREEADEIRKAGLRAADLTRQLLAFSRRQMLRPELLDLNAVVRDMERMLRRLIGAQVEMRTVLQDGLGGVRVDPGQLQQVILNLVLNARDAMPTGGQLTVETCAVELGADDPRLRAGLAPGPYVRLVVSDTGVGMDAETLSHVFEPFFSTKDDRRGTGLGLSTVYGIVEQSGGQIHVTSAPGEGAVFAIDLPLAPGPMPLPSVTVAAPSPQAHGTVLLAEDEPMVRLLARKILERQGYLVLEATDGEAALQLAAAHDGPIHVLVTDIIMPRLGGRELAERLRQLRPGIAVLYMSGYTDLGDDESLLPGAVFLQKPFDPRELADVVRGLVAGAAAGTAPLGEA